MICAFFRNQSLINDRMLIESIFDILSQNERNQYRGRINKKKQCERICTFILMVYKTLNSKNNKQIKCLTRKKDNKDDKEKNSMERTVN